MKRYENAQELREAPYARVSAWMGADGLNLKGDELTVFALMYEREHAQADSGRIDADYIARAIGADGETVYAVINSLVKKGLLGLALSAGSFIDMYPVSEGDVLERLNGPAKTRQRADGPQSGQTEEKAE